MNFLSGLVVFILGSIVGSFLNVVILRYKTGKTVGGRSFCFSCGKTLRALELVPLLSFMVQRGKCRHCKTPISPQYPLVEAVTGLVFLLVFIKSVSIESAVFFWLAFSLLIVIAAYDIRHKIVPDLVVLIFGASSLLWLILGHDMSYFRTLSGILDLLSGPIFFLPFFLLWLFSQGRWMGLGDGKLVVGFGWLLGIAGGASAIVLGFWIAAGLALLMIALKRISSSHLNRLSMKSEVPFAPFLVLGLFLSYYFSLDLLSIGVLLSL